MPTSRWAPGRAGVASQCFIMRSDMCLADFGLLQRPVVQIRRQSALHTQLPALVKKTWCRLLVLFPNMKSLLSNPSGCRSCGVMLSTSTTGPGPVAFPYFQICRRRAVALDPGGSPRHFPELLLERRCSAAVLQTICSWILLKTFCMITWSCAIGDRLLQH